MSMRKRDNNSASTTVVSSSMRYPNNNNNNNNKNPHPSSSKLSSSSRFSARLDCCCSSYPRKNNRNQTNNHDNNDNNNNTCLLTSTTSYLAAQAETRVVNCLRFAVLAVLFTIGALVSCGVCMYMREEEINKFQDSFQEDAYKVLKTFHTLVERNIGAAATLSTLITSYAIDHANTTTTSFPFVTLPDFELHGSHLRVQSGSHVVHWMPLVTDEKRTEWEEYALKNRYHIDQSYERDAKYRNEQDAAIGNSRNNQQQNKQRDDRYRQRRLQQQPQQPQQPQPQQGGIPKPNPNLTVFSDGTNYHPRIWRNGSVKTESDEPDGEGPYLPAWQRSPINEEKQFSLNRNMANVISLTGVSVPNLIRDKQAILGSPFMPQAKQKALQEENLRLSQYREHIEELIDSLSTFLVYPVFDSFGDSNTRQVAGALATNIYWKVLFSNLLPSNSQGIICVVENSFNKTFTYKVEGAESFFVGMGDHHDPKYDDLEISVNINQYLQQQITTDPTNTAYPTVSLSDDNQYRLRVFPSKETEQVFVTKDPMRYTMVMIGGFVFSCILFVAFSYVVEKRQNIMREKVIENAHRVTAAERELNEFLSHEVRNPLSAAISAASFVSSAVNEKEPMKDEQTKKDVKEDMEVVNSSLSFINDFLRSMLDIHRAEDREISIKLAPTDLLKDIFEPVSNILHKRVATFDVLIDCPENLLVMTDSIRLKQVVLNLVRNSSKFVEKGFLRMRATRGVDVGGGGGGVIVNSNVRIYIEDSGPGISCAKQEELFAKYQQSLDLLHQGTGIGLNLSRKLMEHLHGNLWLDDSYDSGIPGCPGACFVVDLNTPVLDIESTLPTEKEENLCNACFASTPCLESTVLANGPDEPQICDCDCNSNNNNTDKNKVDDEEVGQLGNTTASPRRTTIEESSHLLPGLSVLFVDDDAILRKLFVRALKKAEPSWKVQEVSSGETALRLCEVDTFDVIFLDQYMASVDKQLLGTETAQALRANGVESKICGLSANDLRDSFIKAGADDFSLKPLPCKPDELRQLLARILVSKQGTIQPKGG